jgi:tRNA (guanine-N7-)-methyltransferase
MWYKTRAVASLGPPGHAGAGDGFPQETLAGAGVASGRSIEAGMADERETPSLEPDNVPRGPENYAERFIKDFREFNGNDVDEAIIGGHIRATLALPSRIEHHPRLVIPGEPATIAAAQATFFGGPLDEPRSGRPLILEVGSGLGRFLNGLALLRPDARLLGCETRLGFCIKALRKADRHGATNLWMTWGDARLTIPAIVPPGTAAEAYLLYPDPWWKRKHARRRHGALMATVLADALAPGGRLVLKSDVEPYLQTMVEAFTETGRYDAGPAPSELPLTDRELRLLRAGTKTFTSALFRR